MMVDCDERSRTGKGLKKKNERNEGSGFDSHWNDSRRQKEDKKGTPARFVVKRASEE